MSFKKEDGGDPGACDNNNIYPQGSMSPYVGSVPSNYDSPQNVQEQMSRGVIQLFRNLGNKLDQTIDLLGNQLVAQNNHIVEHTRLIANIQQDHLNLHANVEELQGGQRELRHRQSEADRENNKTKIVLQQIKKQVARLEAYNKRREQKVNTNVGPGRGDDDNNNNSSNRNRQTVQCNFCKKILKSSLERHQRNTKRCLQIQELLKNGKFARKDLQ